MDFGRRPIQRSFRPGSPFARSPCRRGRVAVAVADRQCLAGLAADQLCATATKRPVQPHLPSSGLYRAALDATDGKLVGQAFGSLSCIRLQSARSDYPVFCPELQRRRRVPERRARGRIFRFLRRLSRRGRRTRWRIPRWWFSWRWVSRWRPRPVATLCRVSGKLQTRRADWIGDSGGMAERRGVVHSARFEPAGEGLLHS